jgi:FKBP-type peptidyl-prolyl cis-trans isomerase SlyD
MQICKNSVVSINFELRDRDGNLLEKSEQPVSYLHGGYGGIFPVVEQTLEGMREGENADVILEPADAFGEYDAQLVRMESRDVFPTSEVSVGMQFQGASEDDPEEMILYTVTNVADGKVVVDGNHPLAGQTVQFSCTVTEVRAATPEEVAHGHSHGEGGHHHH